MVLLDTGPTGTGRENYSEDADGGNRTLGLRVRVPPSEIRVFS